MKDHVPSPALFHVNNGLQWRNPQMSKIPPQYVDTLRNLMQKKLTKFQIGQHYHQMFIMPEVNLTATVATTVQQIRTVTTTTPAPDDAALSKDKSS